MTSAAEALQDVTHEPPGMDEAVGVLEELIEAAKERRRAQELRELAERLRAEAMLGGRGTELGLGGLPQ